MNIKVQYKGLSTNAILNSGIPHKENDYITFHCFSDTMKARILEKLLRSEGEVFISITNEPRKIGEWFETLDPTARKLV